jgi:ubiquinone biosynthesis accessory factor UbiJ
LRLRPCGAGYAAPAGFFETPRAFTQCRCLANLLQNRERMTNTFPFSFLESVASRFQPPAWAVDEGQQRLVLFINHVIQQEKQAQERLLRQKDRVVHVRFGLFAIDLLVTPAGLVDRPPPSAKPDLLLAIAADSPLVLLQSAMAGKAPPVKIEGDVQLAAEVGWLADNLRWDAEEDLSRLIGDAPAHALARAARQVAEGLKQFLKRSPFNAMNESATAVPSAADVSPVAGSPKAAE